MEKNQQITESWFFVVLLTLSGGFMDAYSYVCREHVFANAQTGNILLFGVNLSTGNFSSAIQYLFPVLAFSFGIAITEIIKNFLNNKKSFHWQQCALLIEIIILLIVAFTPQKLNLFANSLISFACGIQVESFRTLHGSGIATTMCVGNLRNATQALCNYHFTKNKSVKRNGVLYFSMIGIFTLGAVLGNFFVHLWQEKAIIVSSILLFMGVVYMLMHKKE